MADTGIEGLRELSKIINDALTSQLSRRIPPALEVALAPVLAQLAQLQRTHRVIVTPATSPDHAQAQLEASKRYLLEDAFLVIASELHDDPIAIQVMQRLGVYERLVSLSRLVIHWRANPETQAALEVREQHRKTPIAERPAPFDDLNDPVSKDPIHD